MATQSNVTFVDMSPEVKKTLVGLSKTALRESGKVIRKKLREGLPSNSKRMKNHIGSWAMLNYKTGQPTLQIGFYSWQKVKKKGKIPSSMSPSWYEFGTDSHIISVKNAKVLAYDGTVFGRAVQHPGTRATHFLRDTVQNNIAEIRAAQEKYLKELSQTIDIAKGKVYTGEDTEEDD